MDALGPGRYREVAAVRSSMDFGFMEMSSCRIPADSN